MVNGVRLLLDTERPKSKPTGQADQVDLGQVSLTENKYAWLLTCV